MNKNLLAQYLENLPNEHRGAIILHDSILGVLDIFLPSEGRDRRRSMVYVPGDYVDPEDQELQDTILAEEVEEREAEAARAVTPCILPERNLALEKAVVSPAFSMIVATHDLNCFHCNFCEDEESLRKNDRDAISYIVALSDADQVAIIERAKAVLAFMFSDPGSMPNAPVPKDIHELMRQLSKATHFGDRCVLTETLNQRSLMLRLGYPYLFWEAVSHAKTCATFKAKLGTFERKLAGNFDASDAGLYSYCARVLTGHSVYLFS